MELLADQVAMLKDKLLHSVPTVEVEKMQSSFDQQLDELRSQVKELRDQYDEASNLAKESQEDGSKARDEANRLQNEVKDLNESLRTTKLALVNSEQTIAALKEVVEKGSDQPVIVESVENARSAEEMEADKAKLKEQEDKIEEIRRKSMMEAEQLKEEMARVRRESVLAKQNAAVKADETQRRAIQSLRDEINAQKTEIQALEAANGELESANASLLTQRDQLMNMKDDDKAKFITSALDRAEAELDVTRRKLRIQTTLRSELEDKESRRRAMNWVIEELDDEGQLVVATSAAAAEAGATGDIEWSVDQLAQLKAERSSVEWQFPGMEWSLSDNTPLRVVVPVHIAGTEYELTLIATNYPIEWPKLLVSGPERVTDSEGIPLVDIGRDSKLGTLEPINGLPQINYKKAQSIVKASLTGAASLNLSPSILRILHAGSEWLTTFHSK